MNQEESVYELNRIQRYIMQTRPLLKKNALFSDGTADYRQPVEPDAGDEVTVRFRTARDNVDIVWLCTGDKKYKMKKTENQALKRCRGSLFSFSSFIIQVLEPVTFCIFNYCRRYKRKAFHY